MGRIMTLRGSWTVQFGQAVAYGASAGRLIFEYESPDRTRGWKVKSATVFIQECVGQGGGDGRALMACALLTDQIDRDQSAIGSAEDANQYLACLGPSDNRSIAWSMTDMVIRDNTDADWITPHGATTRSPIGMICDADRIITNELYILSYGLSEGQTHAYTACYYIELEEVKLSPSESIFAQLKGVGQDQDEPYPYGFPVL